jgi:hypothetical protein
MDQDAGGLRHHLHRAERAALRDHFACRVNSRFGQPLRRAGNGTAYPLPPPVREALL